MVEMILFGLKKIFVNWEIKNNIKVDPKGNKRQICINLLII